MQFCPVPNPLAQNPFPAPNRTPGGAWGPRGGDDSRPAPQPAGERLRMEQGCLGWALGRCPPAPRGPHAAVMLQVRSGPPPRKPRAMEQHTFSSAENGRRAKPGSPLAYSVGFRQRCGDAGLELLLGSSPTLPRPGRGASPPHLD